MADLALGIDSSTTAVKCVAWDRNGKAVAEGRADIPLQNPAPARYEQDPKDWWSSLLVALAELGGRIDLARVAGMSISNQRETVCFLDEDGEPVRPAILWLDERCKDQVDSFSAEIGESEIHRITGKHKDTTPVVYSLAWMRDEEPANLAATSCFADVHGYLSMRMCGRPLTSWASADPFGCWDIERKRWSDEVLGPLTLTSDRFAQASKPGESLGALEGRAAQETGLPEGTPLFAGGGDGQCAGLGAAATSPNAAYLNLGTAVVSGAYSRKYRWGKAWRTLTALNDGYILENCLRSGTFLLNWLVNEIFGLSGDAFAELDAKAGLLEPGAGGLLLLPYWSGVMNPHWNARARGMIVGLEDGTRREHLYRGVLEGIAMELALSTSILEEETGERIDSYYAVGGGAQSDLWCGIVASASGRKVCRLDTVEASALGAGMCAASGLGWYGSTLEAAEGMGGEVAKVFEPSDGDSKAYGRLLDVYKDMYPQTEALAERLRDAVSR